MTDSKTCSHAHPVQDSLALLCVPGLHTPGSLTQVGLFPPFELVPLWARGTRQVLSGCREIPQIQVSFPRSVWVTLLLSSLWRIVICKGGNGVVPRQTRRCLKEHVIRGLPTPSHRLSSRGLPLPSILGTGEHVPAEQSSERSRGHGPKWHLSVARVLQPREGLQCVDGRQQAALSWALEAGAEPPGRCRRPAQGHAELSGWCEIWQPEAVPHSMAAGG